MRGSSPATSTSQNGYSPQQMKGAYNLSGSLTGAGVTIAIVAPNDDPNAQSDFDTFSAQFGLPTVAGGCNCFTKVNQTGGTQYPPPNTNAATEISEDIEWAHAIAPKAHILLVEANSGSMSDMYTAEDYATGHAKVVCNSWGFPEYSGETNDDVHFNKPVAIVAAAGDSGPPAVYPSASPYVLSVGGTSLTINGTTSGGGCVSSGCTYGGEKVWNNHANGAGGGGVSAFEPQPAYQNGFCGTTTNVNNCGGKRGTPDVAWDADGNTPVAVYDSYNNGGWITLGGTSLGAPSLAGVIALIDQNYKTTVTTNNLSKRFAYQNDAAASNYAADYHDLQSGSNALSGQCCTAGSGWDLANGLGSPNGNNWIASALAWNIVPSPSSGYLNGVAAVTSTNVWAVGYYPTVSGTNTLIEHWNGTKWNVISSPNVAGSSSDILKGVAVVSASDVWAVGDYSYSGSNPQTLIEHWDGTSWHIVTSPNPGPSEDILNGVAVVSANEIWAVGSYIVSGYGPLQLLIEHWDGTSWSAVSSPQPSSGAGNNTLFAVAALSATNVWAVGQYVDSSNVMQSVIEHYDGTSWSIVPTPNPGASGGEDSLTGIVAISASNIWAVGTCVCSVLSSTLIEHYDGASWKVVSSPNAPNVSFNYLNGVAATSSSTIWAVGYYTNNPNSGPDYTLIEHWNGTKWSIVSSPKVSNSVGSVLFGVAAIKVSDAWAVGVYFPSSNVPKTLTERYN
jgi:hypothetical protein